MNKIKITDLFPIFTINDDDKIDSNIFDLFTVDYVINKLDSDKIFSACLYYAPHYKESIQEWEKRYILPIIENFSKVDIRNIFNDNWTLEIFISPDCIKYIEKLKHPQIQFNVMKHASTKTFPGMLWRYIPLSYENKIVVFTDLDTPHPPVYFKDFLWTFNNGYQMIRYSCFRDIDDEKKFIYKSIQGMFITYTTDKNIIRAMVKWMMEETKRIQNTITDDKARYINYQGEKYRIYGTESDSCYANDEMFLSCYLYYKLKDKSLTIFLDYIPMVWKDSQFIVDSLNPTKLPLNEVFKADLDFINYPSVLYMNKHR